MEILARIKKCILLRQVVFTYKAADERVFDDLTELEVFESIVNAIRIEKRIRSTGPRRGKKAEYLYIIISPTAQGVAVYTKGKLVDDHGVETYYLLISSKLAE